MCRFRFAIAVLLAAAFAGAAAAQTTPFLQAGIPSPSRIWSGEDYERAAHLFADERAPLPRLSDPAGATLLKRLASLDNLGLQRDESLPLPVRIEDSRQMERGAGALLKLYLDLHARQGAGQPEMARLAAFLLHLSAQGLALAEEEKTPEAREAVLKPVREGLRNAVLQTEWMLSPENGLTARDQSLLLDALAQTLPHLKPAFPDDLRTELGGSLKGARSRARTEADVRRIDRALRELGGS